MESVEKDSKRDSIPLKETCVDQIFPGEPGLPTSSSSRIPSITELNAEAATASLSSDDYNGDLYLGSDGSCSEESYAEGDEEEYSEYEEEDSEFSSEDDSDWSVDDDEYDDLLAEMPISTRGGHVSNQTAGVPQNPTAALAIPENAPEGLAMLTDIRKELEKVGKMIVAKKEGEKFLERAHILASINWLSASIPACVLDHLGKEIREQLLGDRGSSRRSVLQVDSDELSVASELSEDENLKYSFYPSSLIPRRGVERQDSISSRQSKYSTHSHASVMTGMGNHVQRLPVVEEFQCALMFVDISGFTRLATILDPENLSRVTNAYFEQIVEIIVEHRGDILKFAGDALFAEWRKSSSLSLEQCVQAASACASSLVKECGDFPVVAFGNALGEDAHSPVAMLNIHAGLGVGKMSGVHIGDNISRREYLCIGNPIVQSTEACDLASLGEVVASKEFYAVLKNSTVGLTAFNVEDKGKIVLARGENSILGAHLISSLGSAAHGAKSRGVTDYVDGLEIGALTEYRKLLSLYVHPVVVSKDFAAKRPNSQADEDRTEQKRNQAELRSVYVMFLKALLPVDPTGDESLSRSSLDQLNSIMNVVTGELKRYCGHLRQFIVDDKGFVLIATFGLSGSTFPNLVSERALPATAIIYTTLQHDLGVDCRVGATFGDVYCGDVGGKERHEYSVMGPSVNLAARLMTSSDNPGILVDRAVRQLASRSYGFNALDPVMAKGYRDPVPIYEPLSPLERSWGRIEPSFVGRKEELKRLISFVAGVSRTHEASSKIVLITGPSGIGKSALLVLLIEYAQRSLRLSRRFVVSKHVCCPSDATRPFSAIGSLLQDALRCYCNRIDDHSQGVTSYSHVSMTDASANSVGLVSINSHSSASFAISASAAAEAVTEICMEMGVTLELEAFAVKLLANQMEACEVQTSKIPQNAVSFLCRLYELCTRDAAVTVIAADDLQHCDAESWKVIHHLFEHSKNIVVIGTANANTDSTFRLPSSSFYKALKNEHTASGRYYGLELEGLNKDEIVQMTMKSLGLRQKDVLPKLINEVWVQSGGSPRFAREVLEDIEVRSRNNVGEESQVSDQVSEIILNRIDCLDPVVRNVLNVGAVIGVSFTLNDVVTAMNGNADGNKGIHEDAIAALETAISQGILAIEDVPEEDHTDKVIEGDTSLFFQHDAWHSTLLGLMLDSRKRDIHRKVAQSIEARRDDTDTPLPVLEKLFRHWKATGDTSKVTATALAIGRRFVDHGITVYQEALGMWHWHADMSRGVGGFNEKLLELAGGRDLSSIIILLVALGENLVAMNHQIEAVASFENALRIFQVAPNSGKVLDRSILFPSFTGLATAVRAGFITQDGTLAYEQALVWRFLKETRTHGRLIHHIRGLALQIEVYARLGEFDKAIAVQSVIKNLYKPEKHSALLIKVYGKDFGATSFSFAANWHRIQKNNKQALKLCRHTLKEVVPLLPPSLDEIFDVLYPLLLVFKSCGYVAEAEQFFQGVIVNKFRSSSASDIFRVFEPLSILHELCLKEKPTDMRMSYFKCWATDPENLCLGAALNKRLGSLGRCSDSISAEICMLMAQKLPAGAPMRVEIIAHGLFLAKQATVFNQQNKFMAAQLLAQSLFEKLELLSPEKGRRSVAAA